LDELHRNPVFLIFMVCLPYVGAAVFGVILYRINAKRYALRREKGSELLGAGSDSDKREREMDFLRGLSTTYFENNGVCFNFLLDVDNGIATLNLYYQNRWSQPFCGSATLFHKSIKPMTVKVQGDGGTFGVVRKPFAIPDSVQGFSRSCTISAGFDFPDGKGEQIRSVGGSLLGEQSGGIVKTSLLRILNLTTIPEAVVANYTLPKNVATELPDDVKETELVYWRPGMTLLDREHLDLLPRPSVH